MISTSKNDTYNESCEQMLAVICEQCEQFVYNETNCERWRKCENVKFIIVKLGGPQKCNHIFQIFNCAPKMWAVQEMWKCEVNNCWSLVAPKVYHIFTFLIAHPKMWAVQEMWTCEVLNCETWSVIPQICHMFTFLLAHILFHMFIFSPSPVSPRSKQKWQLALTKTAG